MQEIGSTISVGQRQKILLARAMLSKPNILLLDEATSALDNLTQDVVCKSLEKVNATKIIIAHRINTLKRCNKIVVMNEGKIAEVGTFHDLMKAKGVFYKLATDACFI